MVPVFLRNRREGGSTFFYQIWQAVPRLLDGGMNYNSKPVCPHRTEDGAVVLHVITGSRLAHDVD